MSTTIERPPATACAVCGKNLRIISSRDQIHTKEASYCSRTCHSIDNEDLAGFKLSRAFGSRSPFKHSRRGK